MERKASDSDLAIWLGDDFGRDVERQFQLNDDAQDQDPFELYGADEADPTWVKIRRVMTVVFGVACAGSLFVLFLDWLAALMSGLHFEPNMAALGVCIGSGAYLLGLNTEVVTSKARLWIYLAIDLKPVQLVLRPFGMVATLLSRLKHWLLYGWPALGQRHAPCQCWVCKAGTLYHKRCRCTRCWIRRLRPSWRRLP